MNSYFILIFILGLNQAVLARSNALDEYWKEQDKVAFNSQQDSDGLTIVLSKKESPSQRTKTAQIKYPQQKIKNKVQVVIKSDRQNKLKQTRFFIDQKLVKQKIVKQKQITTLTATKLKNQFFVLEKKRLTAKKTLVRKGFTKGQSEVKLAGQGKSKKEQLRKPSDVDWLTEQEINDAQNEFNETSIQCVQGQPCDPQPICGPSNLNIISPQVSRFSSVAQYFQQTRTTSMNDRWLQTNFGVQIEKKCIDDYGQEFVNHLKDSISEGLSCLDRLEGDASDIHQISIVGLLQDNQRPLKLKCEQNIQQKTFSAEATIFPTEDNFPQINLKKGQNIVSVQKLKEVIFHELMHTNGFAHQADIEYMYACQDCCRDQNQEKASCQICRKNYLSTTDPEYQNDVIQWIKEANGSGASLMAYISSMTSTHQNIKNEMHYLIQGMKLNPALEQLSKSIEGKLNQKQKLTIFDHQADQDLADVIVALASGQVGKARQNLAVIQLRRSKNYSKSNIYKFSNDQLTMLFDQLQAQINQVEMK
jgi:hypothetical protein